MRRLFWTALGATVGVLAVRRASRAVEALTPAALTASVSASLAELADAVRDFAAEVREGMAEREAELRTELGLDADDPRRALDRRPARLSLPPAPPGPDPWTGRHP